MSAERGRSFGRAANEYERGRPDWPVDVVDVVGLPVDATVLDLAAGTGKLTRVLARRFARVIAVEPDDAMRALIPDGEVLAGVAEAIPLSDESIDAVFVATAFHWFDPTQAVPEIARVLRPRGTLVLLWGEMIDNVIPEHLVPPRANDHVKHYRAGGWRDDFAGSRFGEFRSAEFEFMQTQDRDGLLAHLASISWVASMSDAERSAFSTEMRAHLGEQEYRRRWRADVYWARLVR